jgi:CYTH domain-containing protein
MIELELTYLAKKIPEGLENCRFKEIIDVYTPKSSEHPKLRLRKAGDKYELTKKEPVKEGDASNQEEQTIRLTEAEFNSLNQFEGKRVHKLRYYYNFDGMTAEFDVFQDELKGLVVIDFEFESVEEKEKFKTSRFQETGNLDGAQELKKVLDMPDFCLAEVTQEVFIAGGMICGKSYKDVEEELKRFGYNKLFL